MVAIIVGKDRTTYYAHRDVLSTRSDYFRAALTGHFQESQNNRIEFPDQEPATIEMFLRFAYRYTSDEKFSFDRPGSNDDARRFVAFCSFAQTILLERCSNACSDSIRAYLRHKIGDENGMGITAEDMSMLWEYDVGSNLRACLCLAMALRMKNLHERYRGINIAPEIFELVGQEGGLAVTFSKSLVFCHRDLDIRAGNVLSPGFDCLFHDHRKTEPCGTRDPGGRMIPEIREALEYLK